MAYNEPETAAKENSVGSALADFDPVLNRAEKAAHHLQALCDRLNGPRPTAVGQSAQTDRPPSPLLASIHERRKRLVNIIDEIESCAQRLDASL